MKQSAGQDFKPGADLGFSRGGGADFQKKNRKF